MAGPTVPPDDLPSAELALLRAYRSERRMPADAKARMIARLEAPAAATAVRPSRTRWVALAVAIAAVVLLGWAASALRSRSARPTTPSDAEQALHGAQRADADRRASRGGADQPPAAGPTNASVTRTEPEPHPGLDPHPESEPEPEPHPEPVDAVGGTAVEGSATAPSPHVSPATGAGRRSTGRGDRRPRPAPSPEVPGPSGLAQERAILGVAWAALARGDHADALAQAQVHAKRFPQGTLGVERQAIATIAGCNGKRVGWSARAQGFLERHGKAPLARRVRQACELPASPAAP